jgi:hypothetical protein
VTVAVTVTNDDSYDDSFSFLSSSTRGSFKRQFFAKTTDYCVFGAVSVRANPIVIVSDDEDESRRFFRVGVFDADARARRRARRRRARVGRHVRRCRAGGVPVKQHERA